MQESNLHVFVPVKGARKVKVLDAKTHELGVWCAEPAIRTPLRE
jgi:hypothetical protein